jgi:acylphosphatase
VTDGAPTRAHVVVRGRVQGVFFRDGVQEQARALGVAGWVQNRSDGTVEGVFEAPRPAVERVVEWCRTGPPRAHVEGVDVQWEEPEGLVGFRAR